ncbi:erythroblast NAD(P)(+)--arginine ADP-ribosyltransferase-like [Rhinoderma darwinii]|uniref:erythroblast NAD(P)(+)--arginine ADP-ribosyltransferase-like n=1 Tax=Rhinoderma darwinii TaxID=43563 RepID=UPI003F664C8B
MMIEFAAVVCVVHLFYSTQLCCQALDMMPDAFDDQYICCEDKMEREMPKILAAERANKQFDEMWIKATENWSRGKLKLPESFKDEYGVAVVLYTMEKPYPIYKQLNGNVSIAGQSRDYYMTKFHFKALHFYLTRALQVLTKGCAKRFNTYRGSRMGNIQVASELRFGQFTSSSLNIDIAESFGMDPFFILTTCFGVDIADLSAFEEQEILIPVAEKFSNIKKSGSTYTLQSTGQLCSYFNCAYFGEKKRETPVCNSGYLDNNNTLTAGERFIIHMLSFYQISEKQGGAGPPDYRGPSGGPGSDTLMGSKGPY